MPFITITTFAAECDLCGRLLLRPVAATPLSPYPHLVDRTPIPVAATAENLGWLVTTTRLLCPACRRNQTAPHLQT